MIQAIITIVGTSFAHGRHSVLERGGYTGASVLADEDDDVRAVEATWSAGAQSTHRA